MFSCFPRLRNEEWNMWNMTQETVVEDWTNCTTFICIFTSPQQVRLQQTAYAKLSEKISNIKIGNHRPKKPVLLWTSCVVHQCSWRLCCWASNLLSSKYPFIFKLVFECLFEHMLNKRGPVFWSNMGCSPPGQMLLWVENEFLRISADTSITKKRVKAVSAVGAAWSA